MVVPYADFNLLKFPDKAKAKAKIKDLERTHPGNPLAVAADPKFKPLWNQLQRLKTEKKAVLDGDTIEGMALMIDDLIGTFGTKGQ